MEKIKVVVEIPHTCEWTIWERSVDPDRPCGEPAPYLMEGMWLCEEHKGEMVEGMWKDGIEVES